MGQIKIVEYNHSYARAVAEMWNRSSQNWGGYNTVNTEENIIKTHENSSCLNVFLAADGDRVAGYCSFSEYREDGGALYIPLLNADPDYHGQGIGKALVLRALERTLELGWPRLDLYTWPGNTKAVPLYKKCGFFWEKKDNTTHLINLIPTVLTTEAVEDYFKGADWYRDSKRVIEVKPDGISVDGFEYFEYLWEKDGRGLRMQFEKTGRGLRLIETEDYVISTSVEAHSLVFGKNYRIKYDVVNKTGKPLEIEIKGEDYKNISFDFNYSGRIETTETIEGEFYLGKIEEEQEEFRNHPTVNSDIYINGKKAAFKVGVLPRFPGKLKMLVPGDYASLNSEQELYIDLENNFDQEAVFQFTLEGSENIEFINPEVRGEAGPNGKRSIAVRYILRNFHVFSSEIPVRAALKNGNTVDFTARISSVFKGSRGIFWGETDKFWYIVNGSKDVRIEKFDNSIAPVEYYNDEFHGFGFMYPQLGKPFSDEMGKTRPFEVEFYREDEAAVMKSLFLSKDFKGIGFATIIKLYPNGITEYYNEITNESPYEEEIWVNQRFYLDLFKVVLPYKGSFIEVNELVGSDYEHWDSGSITENWIFSGGDTNTRGVCWKPGVKMNFESWFAIASSNLGGIPRGETRRTEPIFAAIGVFKDWKEFRSFALGTCDNRNLSTSQGFEIVVNNGNPFVKDEVEISFREHRLTAFEGSIGVEGKSFEGVEVEAYGEDKNINEEKLYVNLEDSTDIVRVNVDYDSNAMEFTKERAVFKIGESRVETSLKREGGLEVYSADNGIITMKAAPGFSNTLFSLVYNNKEWLDSSYPNPVPKSWFNPWTGGFETRLYSVSVTSLLEEERGAEFVKRTDSRGNVWEGIKLSQKIEKNKAYRGLEINQYFLLLPGVPVVCHFAELHNNIGRYLNKEYFSSHVFVKPDDEIKNSWVKGVDEDGRVQKYKSGRLAYDVKSWHTTIFGSRNEDNKFTIYAESNSYNETIALINNYVTSSLIVQEICLGDGESMCMPPRFAIISGEEYTREQLQDFNNISFQEERGI